MFFILVSSISVVSQFFKHFTKVEKITIRWIALSDLRTTDPWTVVVFVSHYVSIIIISTTSAWHEKLVFFYVSFFCIREIGLSFVLS
jgi:hypothetical protein